jgi:tetratricopeptide (TPR) repeat protein
MGVFVGGCTLEGIEAVCNAKGDLRSDVLDVVTSLVDKCLVQQHDGARGEARFMMLETIHEYAAERLSMSGEAGVLRERHARYFLALAEIADKELRGPGVTFWTKRLLVEQHNLRAALDLTLGSDGAAELSLRLATALWFFWWLVGFHSEGQGWLDRALQGPGDVPADLHARALVLAADLAWRNGDLVQAAKLSAESLGRFRDLGDDWGTAFAVMVLGHVAEGQGDPALAQAHFEESLARFQALGDTFFTASALFDLGELARAQGELTQASVLYEQSLALYRALGHARAISFLATVVAEVAQLQGQHRRAAMLYAESLRLSVETGALSRAARNITRLAELAQAAGELERAARLEGAAEGMLEASSNFQDNDDTNDYFHWPLPARTLPEAGAFAVAWAEGRAMTLEQVVAYALESTR